MYRKTTQNRLSRDAAKRQFRKENQNILAPGRKSAKNASGKGGKEHGAHNKGAGEDGPHFHKEGKSSGHAFFEKTSLIIPGASLGKDLLGDNLLGEAVDLINPLSDAQSLIDIYNDIVEPEDSEEFEEFEDIEEFEEPVLSEEELCKMNGGSSCGD